MAKAVTYSVWDKGDVNDTGKTYNVAALDLASDNSTSFTAQSNISTSDEGTWDPWERGTVVASDGGTGPAVDFGGFAPGTVWTPRTPKAPGNPGTGPSVVPEPSTYALLSAGLIMLYFTNRRRQPARI